MLIKYGIYQILAWAKFAMTTMPPALTRVQTQFYSSRPATGSSSCGRRKTRGSPLHLAASPSSTKVEATRCPLRARSSCVIHQVNTEFLICCHPLNTTNITGSLGQTPASCQLDNSSHDHVPVFTRTHTLRSYKTQWQLRLTSQ